ncbi:MAG TPA: urea amidolyase associated protein UAAP1 [Rariglobus sp.]|jgi:urea carboxylase-associated protein 2|nr:urea amidolyase associated protein UAAP1 [Rariglobus sp.]
MPQIVPPAPSGTSSDTPRPSGPPPAPPAVIPTDRLLHEEILPGGAAWSATVKRGQTLRLTSLATGANVSLLAFNRHDLIDRYNMADTLKGQHTAKLTTGYILVSDMGRAMFSITGDTLGWHDPLGGHDTAEIVRKKWGDKNYQTSRNDWYRNSHDHFLIELTKHGLCTRDLVANVNFFSKVFADTDGRLHFQSDHANAGDFIDLRAEIDLLVILTTCHHPLDHAPVYGPKPVKLQLWRSPPPAVDDYCRTYRPENERAFYNSELLYR